MIVKNYMTINPVTIPSSTTFNQMAQLFYENHFDAFPVVDEAMRLLGIISRTDLLKTFIPEYFDLLDDLSFIKDFGALEIDEESAKMMERLLLADDLMTTKIITVSEDSTLFKAITLMMKNRIRCLPVVRGDKLVGVISRTDILKALLVKKKILEEK
ncbi:CBS domain-containing protein [bacterium]|nr:CBS domain-containing protein [bacterium]